MRESAEGRNYIFKISVMFKILDKDVLLLFNCYGKEKS
jgi:hypothetical protein